MKMRILLAAAAVVCGASFAQAQGDAGCGLGSMVIQENTKVMQLLAATTNGTFGSQTFGISTGTSNCKAQQIVRNDKAIQYFTEANQSDLSREMAQGQGEKLQTLAALYGCQGDAQRAFATKAQASYTTIVPNADVTATAMVQNMNSTLAGTCAAM
jgi:hypothetical protein